MATNNHNEHPHHTRVQEDVEIQEDDDIVASSTEQMASSSRQEEEHVAIRVEKEVATRLGNISEQIYERIIPIPRVPERLREGANGAYDPNFVSIGPYHWGKPLLKEMENYKIRLLQDFLNREPNREHHRLRDYVKEIELLEPRLRSCYDKDIDMSCEKLVEMMLVDGCFVVEVHLQQLERRPMRPFTRSAANVSFTVKLVDMLLLENQLPFFLLQHIYDIFIAEDAAHSYPSSFIQVRLADLRHDYAKNLEHLLTPITLQHQLPQTVHHLLHLEHSIVNSYCSGQQPMIQTSSSKSSCSALMHLFHLITFNFFASSASSESSEINPVTYLTIPSATELHDLGVKFKVRKSPLGSLLANFDHGVLEISPLFFTNMSVTRLHNFIAFERLYFRFVPPCCTAFYKLIDLLVNTASDVALLRKYDIIHHQMGSDEEVALLLNQLNKGMILNDLRGLSDNYLILYNKVNEYCNIKWHRWRATFMRDYCSSPWKTVALVTAFILLALTFIQSYMSLHSYFRPPRS